ncbi:MAG TPA: esterase-like activity of phytase family protein [Conexibacter sp.]|nr:esterase-like activity of phytase family protein [Conexibacter sp.]
MRNRRTRRIGLALGAAAALVPAGLAVAGPGPGSLPVPGSASLDKQIIVGVDVSARAWKLGGFSGLFPLDDSGRRFVSLTDRGPNNDLTCDGVAGREIFTPAFAPRLMYFTVDHGKLALDKVKPMKVGTALTSGLANLPGDEASFSTTCRLLPNDPFGVDTEGVVVDPRSGRHGKAWKRDTTLWIADEYRPSIIRAEGNGELESRIVPKGATGDAYAVSVAQAQADSGNGLNVVRGFPAIVGDRFRHNRGFEDVAIQQFRGRTYLYTALQSPMENPDRVTRDSLAIRVFRLDVTNASHPLVDREWLHVLEVNPVRKKPLADKISSILPAGPDKLLIEERDDTVTNDPTAVTRVWKVDFTRATNLLGGAYDDSATTPSLETQYVPTSSGVVPGNPAGVVPGAKSLCIDVARTLTANGLVNVKLEGMSLVRQPSLPGKTVLAMVDDNDFDLAHQVDPVASPTSLATQLDYLPLPRSCGL